MKRASPLAALAAIASLAAPSLASAQASQCLQEQDVADAAVFLAPSLTRVVKSRCSGQLSADGWMAQSGDAYAARFTALQDKAWPGAMRALSVFAGDAGGAEMVGMFSSIPAATAAPLIEAFVAQEFASEIPVSECRNIERGMELIAPLPPQNTGSLLAFIMTMVDGDDDAFQICEP